MENNLISVIIPVYNMAEYLEKAVKTHLCQTYKNYEIILVDDGSTDSGGVICDKLARQYEKVRTIHKSNGGLSSARNRGIKEAKGEYIIFPDPDDWVDKDYLKCLFQLHEAYQSDIEICGHYVVTHKVSRVHNERGKECCLNNKDAILSLISSDMYCGFAWNKLYHIRIIEENDLWFDEKLGMAQDLHFSFRYMLYCNKIAYNPEPHYYYFQHEKGVTNINHPLTPRKISGLETYSRLYEVAKHEVPEAVDLIGSTIANLNLHFIYVYYNSEMNDKQLLKQLNTNFKSYKKYFFLRREYSVAHKMMGVVALLSPKLYYKIRKRKLVQQ